MTGELSEKIDKGNIGLGDALIEAISEPAPASPYSSERIGEIVKEHVANIRQSSLLLEGISVADIEYDNPEVHPQMMMDNLKDASKRLQIAVKEISRLEALTAGRREQLEKAKIKKDEQG